MNEEVIYYCRECGHEVIPTDEDQLKYCEEDGDNILCEDCYNATNEAKSGEKK